MPVRSSVCTYSPSAMSSSKHSPSPLSIGHYKPISSLGGGSSSSARTYASGSSGTSTGIGSSASRYSLSSSSYSPSSLNSGSYSSLSSTASTYNPSSSTGHYRPLHNSFTTAATIGSSTTGSRYGHNLNLVGSSTSPSGSYKRYSSASSTGSTSSSSLSSASSLLDRTDTTNYTGPYSSISNYNYQPSNVSSSTRRLSYTVSCALSLLFLQQTLMQCYWTFTSLRLDVAAAALGSDDHDATCENQSFCCD